MITTTASRHAQLDKAHGVVFLADHELHSRQESVLPPKPDANRGVQYMVILREYLPVFPTSFWTKYDGRINYKRDGVQAGVTYSYVTPWVLEEARSSPSFAERSTGDLAPIAFVSLRCGNPGSSDGRSMRTAFVKVSTSVCVCEWHTCRSESTVRINLCAFISSPS